MKRVALVTRAIFLNLAALRFQLLVACTGVVALFALGAGQSYNVSWHGFILLDVKRVTGGRSRPSRLTTDVKQRFR